MECSAALICGASQVETVVPLDGDGVVVHLVVPVKLVRRARYPRPHLCAPSRAVYAATYETGPPMLRRVA